MELVERWRLIKAELIAAFELLPSNTIESERNKRLAKIQDLISRLNDSSLPKSFIAGVESGKICNELEGKFYESLKAYFKGRGNNAT